MKWHERNGHTIDMAVGAIVVLMLVALLVAIIMAGAKASAASCLTADVPPQAVIGRNDGDTFGIYWFGPGVIRIRVQGIDTPEKPKNGTVSDGRWEAAAQFTRSWLMKGPFKVETCFKRTLDRYEGTVTRGGESLADALRQAGHSKKRTS